MVASHPLAPEWSVRDDESDEAENHLVAFDGYHGGGVTQKRPSKWSFFAVSRLFSLRTDIRWDQLQMHLKLCSLRMQINYDAMEEPLVFPEFIPIVLTSEGVTYASRTRFGMCIYIYIY